MIYAAALLLLLAADQLVKLWVVRHMELFDTMALLPGFVELKYVQNTGGGWSVLSEHTWLLSLLTALIMAVAAQLPHRGLKTSRGLKDELRFILRYGRCHASPNSGYPEAALAGILDCRFGGTHNYFGQSVAKPYIGYHDRPLRTEDMQLAVSVNQWTELLMVVGGVLLSFL